MTGASRLAGADGWSTAAGLPPEAEDVLEHLVTHPESTAADVASALGLPTAAVIAIYASRIRFSRQIVARTVPA